MSQIINRKYKNGVVVSEEVKPFDWEPNEADLDLVDIECECGNKFDLPFDCLMFGFDGIICCQCGESGKFKAIEETANEN